MGARHSKRLDIASASKKGEAENGAIVGTEEKLEKIEEGETVVSKSNANGSTTTSSTVTAEQQETSTTNTEVAAAPETSPSKELETKSETITDVAATEKSITEEATSPSAADDSKQEVKSPASPSEATTTTEEGASSTEKKKRSRKKWSFRTFSFSKKDKQKPVAAKDETKQQETLAEANETSPSETQNNDETEKKTKEEEEKKKDEQVPPPLPTSPPPTPAEEIAVVETPTAPVAAVPAVPEKEETLNISDGDVEVSGGGEGLAEPLLEDGELLDDTQTNASEPAVASNGTTPLTNGEVKLNGTVTENGNSASPVCELKTPVAAVDDVTSKIDSLKLKVVTDSAEAPAQNGFSDHSVNGDLNGTDVNGGSECLTSDAVVSAEVSAEVSADN